MTVEEQAAACLNDPTRNNPKEAERRQKRRGEEERVEMIKKQKRNI